MTSSAVVALLAGFGAATALLLIAMSFIFAELTGWRRLARSYGSHNVRGERLKTEGVIIGAHGFNGPPLCVVLDERGIALVPARVFRLAFASFLIPWRLVQSFENRAYVLFDVVELRFGPGGGSLLGFVPSKATEAIAARLYARGTRA